LGCVFKKGCTSQFRLDEEIYVFSYINEKIGDILFTSGSGFNHGTFTERDYYKILALIHEKTVFEAPYFICKETQKKAILEWSIKRKTTFTISTEQEFWNDFPKDFFELQRRVLMLMYKMNPKYGGEITVTPHLDCAKYFTEDNQSLFFLLESMIQKGWIATQLKQIIGGGFVQTTPIVIQGEGWTEIEKNIRQTYSAFVAM
jgi:hypothetical protein